MKNITLKGIVYWVTYDTNRRKFETKLHSPKEHRMESSTLNRVMHLLKELCHEIYQNSNAGICLT